MTPIILIGHRGAGKTTLAATAAQLLARTPVDLDAEIELRTGRRAADFVRDDEPGFRATEREVLDELVRTRADALIATGGGITGVPPGALVVWIDRDGWEEIAFAQRERLRPDLPFEKEVEWMKWDRESRYARLAHIRLRLERDCAPLTAAERLAHRVGWMHEAARDGALGSTWMLVPTPDDLARCAADARMCKLAGIELRTDLVTPDILAQVPAEVPVLASLRAKNGNGGATGTGSTTAAATADDFPRQWARAAAFDVDIRFIDAVDFEGTEPRLLILSTHPRDVHPDDFAALVAAGERVAERWPAWRGHIVLKYAPVVKSWMELRVGHELCRVHLRRGGRVSYLPQGRAWHWVRVMRMRWQHQLNYVRPGCATEGTLPPPLELFVPTAVGPAPERWCAIIGRPVEHSAGDVWHRAASLARDGGRTGYLKIPLSPEEKEHGVYFLMKLGFHGLSVTAPLKNKLFPSTFITRGAEIDAGNTLTFRNGGWSLTDTDEAGMRASLRALVARGIAPGPVAVFGRGGVLAAVERACAAEGWQPVFSAGAREGWTPDTPRAVRLVVDASASPASRTGAPAAEAWLDLAYTGCPPPPPGVGTYMSGRIFFEAQAEAQRAEWRLDDARAANGEQITDAHVTTA